MAESLVAIGAFIIGLGAVALALTALVKSPFFGRPIRWLFRVNVAEPLAEWNGRVVGKIIDERIEHLMTHNNGGSSLKDLADSVALLLEHDEERDVLGRRYGPDDGGEMQRQGWR